MKFGLCVASLFFLLTGCYQGHSDADLRGVPVTNNPNLLPSSSQTAHVPGM